MRIEELYHRIYVKNVEITTYVIKISLFFDRRIGLMEICLLFNFSDTFAKTKSPRTIEKEA